jgi:cytochrome c oxidase cbb3-type subunit III
MRHSHQFWLTIMAVTSAALLAGCKREERGFRVSPPAAEAMQRIELSDLRAGQHWPSPPVKNEYEQNAYAMNEGQRLYEAFNCSGCHAHGGGDKGPALMDDTWIYGSNPEQIFATIVEGRPNGMPAFRGKIPDHQVWQIVAYVRSLSGLVSKNAAPGRNDEMQTGPPPNTVERATPKNSSTTP